MLAHCSRGQTFARETKGLKSEFLSAGSWTRTVEEFHTRMKQSSNAYHNLHKPSILTITDICYVFPEKEVVCLGNTVFLQLPYQNQTYSIVIDKQ